LRGGYGRWRVEIPNAKQAIPKQAIPNPARINSDCDWCPSSRLASPPTGNSAGVATGVEVAPGALCAGLGGSVGVALNGGTFMEVGVGRLGVSFEIGVSMGVGVLRTGVD